MSLKGTDIAVAKEAFTKIVWWLCNVSYEDFIKVYEKENGPAFGSYGEDLFCEMKRNPAAWLMNVDSDLQNAIIEAALVKYMNAKI